MTNAPNPAPSADIPPPLTVPGVLLQQVREHGMSPTRAHILTALHAAIELGGGYTLLSNRDIAWLAGCAESSIKPVLTELYASGAAVSRDLTRRGQGRRRALTLLQPTALGLPRLSRTVDLGSLEDTK